MSKASDPRQKMHEFLEKRFPGARQNTQRLSKRQAQVFTLMGQGLGTADLAQKLKLSPRTVEEYHVQLRQRLGIKTATQVAAFAALWLSYQFVFGIESR